MADLFSDTLDNTKLCALLDDLEACAEIINVRVKERQNAMSSTRSFTIGEVRELLAQNTVAAVQVTYRWEGSEWIDTIVRTPDGARVFRTKLDA